jgi:hypothetical protein
MAHQSSCLAGQIGVEGVRNKQRTLLDTYGWYSHIIPQGGLTNCHTHGLERLGHLDFQLVLPIDGNILLKLATMLVDRVKGGEKFEANMRVSGVVANYDVLLITAKECERNPRQVLRVILPDQKGNLDEGRMDALFASQYNTPKH